MNITEIKNNTIYVKEKSAPLRSMHNCNVYTKDGDSTTDKISKVAKEIATDMIPIYGTINAFKQGKIGWGIFGIVTDVLTIVPIIGAASKLVLALSASAKGIKELSAGAACLKLAGSITKLDKADHIVKSIADADLSSKYINNSIKDIGNERIIEDIRALNSNERTYDIEDELFKDSYPSLESIEQGKAKLTLPYEDKPSISQYFCGINKEQKWKPGIYTERDIRILKNTMEDMFREFNQLGDSLNKQLSSDLKRSTYILNGKIIPKDDPEKMLETIKDLLHHDHRKTQLLSTFANQAILAGQEIHLMGTDARLGEHLYAAKNGKSLFEINTLDNDIMKISATYETKTEKIFEDYKNIKELNGYGHKIELTLSPDKIIDTKTWFYTN